MSDLLMSFAEGALTGLAKKAQEKKRLDEEDAKRAQEIAFLREKYDLEDRNNRALYQMKAEEEKAKKQKEDDTRLQDIEAAVRMTNPGLTDQEYGEFAKQWFDTGATGKTVLSNPQVYRPAGGQQSSRRGPVLLVSDGSDPSVPRGTTRVVGDSSASPADFNDMSLAQQDAYLNQGFNELEGSPAPAPVSYGKTVPYRQQVLSQIAGKNYTVVGGGEIEIRDPYAPAEAKPARIKLSLQFDEPAQKAITAAKQAAEANISSNISKPLQGIPALSPNQNARSASLAADLVDGIAETQQIVLDGQSTGSLDTTQFSPSYVAAKAAQIARLSVSLGTENVDNVSPEAFRKGFDQLTTMLDSVEDGTDFANYALQDITIDPVLRAIPPEQKIPMVALAKMAAGQKRKDFSDAVNFYKSLSPSAREAVDFTFAKAKIKSPRELLQQSGADAPAQEPAPTPKGSFTDVKGDSPAPEMDFRTRANMLLGLQQKIIQLNDALDKGEGDKQAIRSQIKNYQTQMDKLDLPDDQMRALVQQEITAAEKGEATPPAGMSMPEYLDSLYSMMF